MTEKTTEELTEEIERLHQFRVEDAKVYAEHAKTLAKNLMEVYEERSKVVLALARTAYRLNHRVGWGLDLSMDQGEALEWPILYIDLPSGQVSWHMTADDRKQAEWIPPYAGGYDGHTTAEKYERLAAWRPNEMVYPGEPLSSPPTCAKITSGYGCVLESSHRGPCRIPESQGSL